MRRSWLSIMVLLTALIGQLLPIMLLAIVLGVAGFLCAIFLIVFSTYALLDVAGIITVEMMVSLPIIIILCAALRGILRYGEQLAGHHLAFKLLVVFRDRVFSVLRKLAPAKLEKRDKGDLITVITGDIELLEVFYAHTVAPIAIALITSLFMTVFIGYQSLVLGLIAALAYLTVGLIIPTINSGGGRKGGVDYRGNLAKTNSYFLESILGLKEIIRNGSGENRLKAIGEMTAGLNKEQASLKRREGLSNAITDGLVLIFSGLALCVGLYQMYYQGLDLSRVIVATIALFSSFGPVVALASLSNNLPQTMASAERVLDLLAEKPETPEIERGEKVVFIDAQCEKVGFSYGKEKILHNLNLSMPKNRIIGISGQSGSGKSTLLKLLMRFWDVNEGKVQISGKDIRNINTQSLRSIEGYVTQEAFLFQGSLEDNIRLAKPEAGLAEIERAAAQAGIKDFINSLPRGFQTHVGELGEGLSGGERQRIALARVFLHGAPLLLLDEPTSNLDSLNEATILKSLQEASQGKTIILVSHRMSSLKIAQKIYKMEKGRLQDQLSVNFFKIAE